MKTPGDPDLDSLLREAAGDPRPADWTHTVSRGLEARVLQRLARPESWAEAIFSLTSWRPLAAAAAVVLAVGVWGGRSAMDVFNEDWLTTQSAEPEGGLTSPGLDEFDF